VSIGILDEFQESEMFDELCRARWREFKERMTKEQRAARAEVDARGLAELVEGRFAAGRGRAGPGEAWPGMARQGKASDAPHGTQGLIEGIEGR